MSKSTIVLLMSLTFAGLLLFIACEGDDGAATYTDSDDESGGGNRPPSGDSDSDSDVDSDTDSDSDSDSDFDSDDDICDEQDFSIEFKKARVMILLDNSGSMTEDAGGSTKEVQAVSAITLMVNDPINEDKEFGLDIFPDGSGGFLNSGCGTNGAPPVPIADANAQNIINYLNNSYNPDGATPLLAGLKYYATQANATSAGLYGDNTSGYIVVVSDGSDTCYSGFNIVQQLRATTTELVNNLGIRSFAIGFGSGVSGDELNAIAQNGGTSILTYLQADNETQLQDAFEQIASDIVSCRFEIDEHEEEIDPDEVNFYFNDSEDPVPMDPNNQNGWNWVDDENTTMEFFGEYCDDLKEGEVESVSATFGCPTIVID